MIYAWWLPKRDIDPLIKKQLELTNNLLSKEHQIGHDLAKELFKETAVEIGYVGVADKQGKLHTVYPIKKEKTNETDTETQL